MSEGSNDNETNELKDKSRLVQEIVSQVVDARNLSGVDLSRANLRGAYLNRANLIRANLDNANLIRANLLVNFIGWQNIQLNNFPIKTHFNNFQ